MVSMIMIYMYFFYMLIWDAKLPLTPMKVSAAVNRESLITQVNCD